jgi:cell division protein FtsL
MIKKNPFYLIFGIILFGILVTVFVANGIAIRNTNKKIDERTSYFELLLNENKKLRTQYEALIARDRIVSIASSQLGMVFPAETPQILEIDRERLTTMEGN